MIDCKHGERKLLRDMTQTFRDAGGAAGAAEQANQQLFGGGTQ